MPFIRFALLSAMLFYGGAQPVIAASATPDDTAKFLAGIQPSAGSPLAALTKQEAWQGHSRFFERTWSGLDKSQISKVRAWSETTIQQRQPTLYYMFSGPDFLYADAFFPKATTYVMAGLEPVGQIPDVAALPAGAVPSELRSIEASLSALMRYSFFITKSMRVQFANHRLTGTIPPLYVFLARSGKTITDISLIDVDNNGEIHPQSDAGIVSAAKGVKIVFTGSDSTPRTLYYFQTDVSNDGLKKSGFLAFCEKLGAGNGFVKSASYLMHSDNFSSIREFLLKQTSSILQDDSGIPVKYFSNSQWDVKPYGRYVGPIRIFYRNYQRSLTDIYRTARPAPLDFGIGYRIRAPESSLVLAVKKSTQAGLNTGASSD